MLTLVLTAQIPSGKNAIRETFVRGKKIRYPTARFKRWREQAAVEILQQRARWPVELKLSLPLRGRLVATIAYCEREPVPAGRVRDVPGMMDALWHLLDWVELVEDDGQIRDVTWREIERGDPQHNQPCLVLRLTGRTETAQGGTTRGRVISRGIGEGDRGS